MCLQRGEEGAHGRPACVERRSAGAVCSRTSPRAARRHGACQPLLPAWLRLLRPLRPAGGSRDGAKGGGAGRLGLRQAGCVRRDAARQRAGVSRWLSTHTAHQAPHCWWAPMRPAHLPKPCLCRGRGSPSPKSARRQVQPRGSAPLAGAPSSSTLLPASGRGRGGARRAERMSTGEEWRVRRAAPSSALLPGGGGRGGSGALGVRARGGAWSMPGAARLAAVCEALGLPAGTAPGHAQLCVPNDSLPEAASGPPVRSRCRTPRACR